ncbi:MAG: DUF6112 family protein [Actinomycetota bacterium]
MGTGVGPGSWLVLVAQVRVSPDPGALPGGAQLQQIVNGLAGLSLIALAGAAIAGAVWWAVGAAGSHPASIMNGKRMVLVAVVAALVVGATPALINFFRALGGQL